jgi:hypothetical protein
VLPLAEKVLEDILLILKFKGKATAVEFIVAAVTPAATKLYAFEPVYCNLLLPVDSK